MNEAWYWGFFMGTVTAIMGFIAVAFGKPFYRFPPLGNSPILRIAQVIVVAVKNRRFSLPENPDELFEVNDKERDQYDEKLSHTNQLRSLDKAAILPEEISPRPWKVCIVTSDKDVAHLSQYHYNEHMLGPIADILSAPRFLVVPFARKITGHPPGITQLQRVGVDLVLSIISMGVAGLIEVKRRDQAIKDPFKPISLFWLFFQYGIFGLADMFTIVGLMEFFYKEAPSGMKSLATSFAWLSLSFGYFLSTAFVDIINSH
ncbi:hypothetical protein REPUB_Repub11eG0111200 [Reevesia pubescens]